MRPQSHRNLILMILTVFLATGSLQCSDKDDKNSKVKFSIVPDTPVVIPADLTIPDPSGGEDIQIKGPYFKFDLKVANELEPGDTAEENEKRTIVVTALRGKVYGMGNQLMGEFAFDAGQVNRNVFFSLGPGEEFSLYSTYGTLFYVADLKADKDSPTFYFRVEVEPIGWYGTELDAKERYLGTFSFYTQ